MNKICFTDVGNVCILLLVGRLFVRSLKLLARTTFIIYRSVVNKKAGYAKNLIPKTKYPIGKPYGLGVLFLRRAGRNRDILLGI